MKGEFETRLLCNKYWGNTLKIMHTTKSYVPKLGVSTLFSYKPLLLGLNCIFDESAPKWTGLLQGVIGFRPHKHFVAYLKQY